MNQEVSLSGYKSNCGLFAHSFVRCSENVWNNRRSVIMTQLLSVQNSISGSLTFGFFLTTAKPWKWLAVSLSLNLAYRTKMGWTWTKSKLIFHVLTPCEIYIYQSSGFFNCARWSNYVIFVMPEVSRQRNYGRKWEIVDPKALLIPLSQRSQEKTFEVAFAYTVPIVSRKRATIRFQTRKCVT